MVLASREDFDDFGPGVTGGMVPIKISLPSFSAEETRQIISEQLSSVEGSTANRVEIEKCVKIVQQVANSTVNELSMIRSLTSTILQSTTATSTSNSKSAATKLPKMIKERLDETSKLDSFYKQTVDSLNLIEKYLLVSSFIASFQTSKEDSKVFGSVFKRTKISKSLNSSKDSTSSKNVDKLTIQLPKLFGQTRLIAIFYHLVQNISILPSPQQLQLHIKTLCDRGLLKFSGNSFTKIDSLKYRVNISKDFASIIAVGIDVNLNNLNVSIQH